MFTSLAKPTAMMGSVFFRGTLPLRVEEFDTGQMDGVRSTRLSNVEGMRWALRLEHDVWGHADLFCLKEDIQPPRVLLEFDPRLTPEEAAAIMASRSQLSLRMQSRSKSQLRERKHLLRFLYAVLGSDEGGIAAVDHLSQRFWPRESLEDELSHDADLDVEGLYSLHDVRRDADREGEETPSAWLHSHGLGELGLLDFDILEMCPGNRHTVADLARAMAFAVIEGRAKAGEELELASPPGNVLLVTAKTFEKSASPNDRALRDDPDGDHLERRVVLCELLGARWSRWLRGDRPRPSGWLKKELPEETVFSFSSEASKLMGLRARNTYNSFRSLAEEFADLELPTLVKLGYRVDDGGETDLEHLWFRVEHCHPDRVTAVLENEPFGIKRMKQGDRGDHPIDRLSDWTIFTPAGAISPRDFTAARRLRKHHREIRELMRRQRQSPLDQ